MSHLNHEAIGAEAAISLLNTLQNNRTQAAAVPAIKSFLENLASIRGRKARQCAAGCAAAMLVDVLLLGMAAVRERDDHEA